MRLAEMYGPEWAGRARNTGGSCRLDNKQHQAAGHRARGGSSPTLILAAGLIPTAGGVAGSTRRSTWWDTAKAGWSQNLPNLMRFRVGVGGPLGGHINRERTGFPVATGRVAREMRPFVSLPLSIPRCNGSTGVSGKILPPCIKCRRRIVLDAERKSIRWGEYRPLREDNEWVCNDRIDYDSEIF